MLASTMQFSSNGRTHQANPHHHTQQPTSSKEPASVSRYDTNLVTRTRTRNPQPPLITSRPAGCLRTQQCARRTTPTRQTAFQPVTSTGVLAANPDSRRLFVNVPPMSNHPRHVRPGPGLCHQHQPRYTAPAPKNDHCRQPATPLCRG